MPTTPKNTAIWVVLNIPATNMLAAPGDPFEWNNEEDAKAAADKLGGFAYQRTPEST